MPATATREVIYIRQFKVPGSGEIVDRGTVERVVRSRRVRVPLLSAPITWVTYHYVEFNGEEYQVTKEGRGRFENSRYVEYGKFWTITLRAEAVIKTPLDMFVDTSVEKYTGGRLVSDSDGKWSDAIGAIKVDPSDTRTPEEIVRKGRE